MFTPNIKFKYSWRPYQEKVLKEVHKYISDKRINIIAAPGSGKTVLGLELVRRLDNPVLILSPTVTIKNQWIDRFVTLFMPEGSKKPDWISDNVYELTSFNSITYQGLHYAYKRRKQKNEIDPEETDDEIMEEEVKNNIDVKEYDLVSELKKNKISTIVLDEAHHLKSEWWQSLTKVIEELQDVTIISLTATPPYDIEKSEWDKYISLCGDIDMEISVPELVQAKNLCPHQDYIYFSYPTQDEKKMVSKYETNVRDLIKSLNTNQEFIQMLQNHPYIQDTGFHVEEILEKPEFYSSMIIFLNACNVPIDAEKIQILGHNNPIPKLTIEWMEKLLQNVIIENKEDFNSYENVIADIESKLNNLGAIEKNKVFLVQNPILQKYFVNSLSKLESINNIVESEYNNLKNDLRMVILTDFLRKEYLFEENIEIKKIGVFPIFLNLINKKPNLNVAILTGSIFMIPNAQKEKLIENTSKNGVGLQDLQFIDVDKVPNYCIVKTSDKNKNILMSSISKLFSNGDVNIIIGTKSLLGEGWDEPSINSLILASFVGSYVLSNQMRGRAIRTNDNPYKTANVWHLVCASEGNDIIKNADFEMLKRRFNSFVGIGYHNNLLENGIDRLDNIPTTFSKENIDRYNQEIIQISNDRQNMYDRWFKIIEIFGGRAIRLNNQLEAKQENLKNNFSFIQVSKVLKFIFTYLLIAVIDLMIENSTMNLKYIFENLKDGLLLSAGQLIIIFIISMVLNLKFVIQCIRAMSLSIPKKQLKRVAKIVIKSLYNTGIIKTDYDKIKISSVENNAIIELSIDGVTTHENNIIVSSLKEIFSDVENQRYIIINKSKIISSYYNVPNILSTNKELATEFYNNWVKYMGNCILVYTKSVEGRKILLKARKNTFNYTNVNKFIDKKKPISNWE